MKKLTRARKKRDWTIYRLAKETGINEQVIRNLEGDCATRQTQPCEIKLRTAITLIETLSELSLADFLPGSKLKLVRRRGGA